MTPTRHPILAIFLLAIGAVEVSTQQVFAQRRRPVRFGPGVCGPVDESYVRSATETGGQVIILAPDELAHAAAAVDATTENEPILWASGDSARTYSVPVDASVERVVFVASFDAKGGSLAVTAPDGSAPTGNHVRDITLYCGRIVVVDRPQSGAWRLELKPTGRFWLIARVKGDLSVVADFVRPGGRPGHEGLFKIPGQPVLGRTATLRVKFWPTAWGDSFSLMSVDGRPIRDVALQAVSDDEFVGTIELPEEPFRVAARGVDDRGAVIQRMTRRLFRPTRIDVQTLAGPESVAPGATAVFRYVVRNGGAPVRLNLSAVERLRGQKASVNPAVIDLATGEEREVVVRTVAPSDGGDGFVGVLLTAYDERDPTTGNFAVAETTVDLADE